MDQKDMNYREEDVIVDEILSRRDKKDEGFQVEILPGETNDTSDVVINDSIPADVQEELPPAKVKKGKKQKKEEAEEIANEGPGCARRLLRYAVILLISVALSSVILFFLLDSLAINKDDKNVDVEIPAGANTEQIAEILEKEGLIQSSLYFRVYSRFTGADGKWQVGSFSLSTAMDYSSMIEALQTMVPRETVTVTIPEGKTVDEIAKILEKHGVCDPIEFYDAVMYGKFDYDFVNAIPTESDGEEYAGRKYRLEGYLFPDTYNFYLDSSGETVVQRMLDNFDQKLTDDLRKQIKKRGWTIDEAVIVASLVEGEAATKDEMEKVSKVLQNRMAPNSGFPKLELCSTRDYAKSLLPSAGTMSATSIAYDTYEREGLPVGAINNPGLQAITAALYPSTDPSVKNCYFFATDYDTETTYFSNSFREHENVCRKYGIGMYG